MNVSKNHLKMEGSWFHHGGPLPGATTKEVIMKTKSSTTVPIPKCTSRTTALLAAVLATAFISESQAQTAAVEMDIVSDTSWKSSSTVAANLDWIAPPYDDSGWANAIVLPDYPYPPTTLIPGTLGQHVWHSPHSTNPAYFRKSFVIPGSPQESKAFVRVDDIFEFYVNGVLVGVKPRVQPTTAQEYDITPHLREGANVFAIRGEDIIDIDRSVLFDADINYIPNNPPDADAGTDQTIPLGTKASLNGGDSTDDHTPTSELSCKWTVISAPVGSEAVLTGEHTLYPGFVPDQVGVYTLELLVLDSSGLEGVDETTVTVIPLLANGSFEQDFNGWIASGNVRIQTSPTPTHGVKLAGFNAGNTTANGRLTQTFTTEPGRYYQVSFDMGALAWDTSKQTLTINVIGSPYEGIYRMSVQGLGGGKTTWEAKSIMFPASGTSVSISFLDTSTATNGIDLLLDNVKVTTFTSLRNGSFEAGFDGWTTKSGSVEIRDTSTSYPAAPTNGTRLAVFNVGDATANGRVGQSVETIPGVKYLLTFDMGVLAYNTAEQQLQVSAIGAGAPTGSFTVRGIGSGKTLWETKQMTFTAQDTMTRVIFYDASTTTSGIDLLLDNVKIEVISSLANGSFEQNLTGWAASGNVRAVSLPPAATDGSKFVDFSAANLPNTGVLSQTFATVPGATYPLSFDLGLIAYVTGWQEMKVEVTGSSNLMTQVFRIGRNSPGDATRKWESKSMLFVADSAATKLTFSDVSLTSNSIDLWLDNVRVALAPTDFVLIPAGSFQMGNAFPFKENDIWGDGETNERPVHSAYVSAFFMAKHETTKELWDSVRSWGLTHGYTDLPAGAGKASNHPVHSVNWTDAVKWCNARSEKEGFTPCYKVAGAVYRTGDGGILPTHYSVTNDVVCDWSANGYRLPTEAEWEKAARSGQAGRRFPWSDVISQTQANFYSSGTVHRGTIVSGGGIGSTNPVTAEYGLDNYSSSYTLGYHPEFDEGAYPFTSPVGSFPANSFGLYDMAGNQFELLWDHPAIYSTSAVTDPTGGLTGGRVIRGGSWARATGPCRVSARWNTTGGGHEDEGFRLARTVK